MNNWNWKRALHTMRAPLRKCQRAAQQPHSSNGIYALRLLHSEYSSQEIIILVDTSTLTCWISISKYSFPWRQWLLYAEANLADVQIQQLSALRSALFLDCGVANTNPQSCFLPKYYEKQTFHCISAASKKVLSHSTLEMFVQACIGKHHKHIRKSFKYFHVGTKDQYSWFLTEKCWKQREIIFKSQ